MGGQHVWRMSGGEERGGRSTSTTRLALPPTFWAFLDQGGRMVEELLTSRPPLLLSCCLEGNPDNMKCDA